MGPQLGGLWDDSERRYSGDYVLPNRSYGDRGSGMGLMDGGAGKGGKRLRFSDERPLEATHYGGRGGGGGYSPVGQAY